MSTIALGADGFAKVVEIAESLAFLMPMGEISCPISESWGPVTAITWQGADASPGGCLWLALTPDAAIEAARNMCGLPPDEPISAEDAAGAVDEMANVILGNLLPLMHGATAEFHLGTPRRTSPDEFPSSGAQAMDLGGGILAVALADDCE